jgi:tetratricopeptide (TPR) repeat protein
MMDDLIGTLGSLGRMKVNPKGDVIHYKKNRPKLEEIANELKCRYIVEGAVQKLGERIRIKVSLTDIVEHRHVWNGKYDGTFDDIFDLQDKTCFAIAEALQLKLQPEDKRKIEAKPTENAEAYELYLRGISYGNRVTQNDTLIALSLFAQASKADPEFLGPLISTVNLLISMHEYYTRDPHLLDEAEDVVQKALGINSEDADVYRMLAKVYAAQGKIEEAIEAAEKAVDLKPYLYSYMTLGQLHIQYTNRNKDAIEAFEKALIEAPGDLHLHYMIPMQHRIVGDSEGMQKALERAIPFYELYTRTHPEDQNKHMNLAVLLYIAGRHQDGLHELEAVLQLPNIDGATYFNASGLHLDAGNYDRSLDLLEKAIDSGWSKIEQIDHEYENIFHDDSRFLRLKNILQSRINSARR